jgi:hypothetical protein
VGTRTDENFHNVPTVQYSNKLQFFMHVGSVHREGPTTTWLGRKHRTGVRLSMDLE